MNYLSLRTALQVGLAILDLRSPATLHLNQFLETSRSYQNTLTMLDFYHPLRVVLLLPERMSTFEDGRLSFSTFVNSASFGEFVRVSE